jgi:hypothetical protein
VLARRVKMPRKSSQGGGAAGLSKRGKQAKSSKEVPLAKAIKILDEELNKRKKRGQIE